MMKIDTEFLISGPADDDYNYQGVAPQTFSPPMWSDTHGLQFSTPDIWFKGALSPNAKCNDTTIYVTDPSGQLVPPPPDPNVDKNVYVYFPTGSGGPFLGAGQAIDMGPLWWIRQLGTNINVWYWYISPVQQPKCWSYFGNPPEGANPTWGYRGFNLLPYFPVAWLLSENYPLAPLGTYGAPNLTVAAGGYITGAGTPSATITVNWAGLGTPEGGWAVSTTRTDTGGLGVGLPIETYTTYSFYMPFGAFDLTGPTAAERLKYAADQGADVSIYTDHGGPQPNMWELTGIDQPPLVNPGKPWDPSTNPHQTPSAALAQQVCQTFADNWNATAQSINAAQDTASGGDSIPGYPFVPPPEWPWEKPYGGDTVDTAQMFSNGWAPAVLPGVNVPTTVPTIAVGQLDNAVWNNQIVLTSAGVSPPVPWIWSSYNVETWEAEGQDLYDLALTDLTP